MGIPGKILMTFLLLVISVSLKAQRLKVGITFQYHILKQVKVDADIIKGAKSYSLYYVTDNRLKFFSAGQSMVIGTILQLDYKKFYFGIEPSYNLNTYNYTVDYPLTPQRNERLNFQVLFFQIDTPFYLGYQFQSSNIFRYSFFAGGVVCAPYHVQYQLTSKLKDNPQQGYFHAGDMEGILYNEPPYLNALAGFGIHFASLGRIDIRYQYRLKSPGDEYKVNFHTLGFGLTYYLPINLLNKKIYYED